LKKGTSISSSAKREETSGGEHAQAKSFLNEFCTLLVTLNKERAAEEAKGFVRWLRPEYQVPRFGSVAEKKQLEADFGDEEQKPTKTPAAIKPNFPTDPVDQVAAVMAALAVSDGSVTAADLSRQFKQGRKVEARVAATLSSLARTGFISTAAKGQSFAIRRAI
jgi:hypothetical protein